MKIPVWLLNYNLIKAATAKLCISAQINYSLEISGKSAKGSARSGDRFDVVGSEEVSDQCQERVKIESV